MAISFDIEPRFISGATGNRLAVNPDDILPGTSWEELEAGGTGQISVALARPYDAALGVAGGDIVEAWARNEDGTETLRARGVVTIPEPTLDLKEQHKLVAYGLMEDMNHVLLDKVIVRPGGVDLSQYAAEILDDYVARRPGLSYVRDIQNTGVKLETLTAQDTTARAAMDILQTQAGRRVAWGWDIDPSTNQDRFYLRPRITDVEHQWFVGDRVRVLSSPLDHTNITNAIKLHGGTAQWPNLAANSSFEQPSLPNVNSGSLLLDGDFEDTSDVNVNWHFNSGSGRDRHAPESGRYGQPHSGTWYGSLRAVGGEIWQEAAVTPGVTYVASLYAAREIGSHVCTGVLYLEGRDAGGTVIETAHLDLAPPSSSYTGGQGSTILSSDGISLSVTFVDASIVTCRLRVVATAVPTDGWLLIDDVVFADSTSVGTNAWNAYLQRAGDPLGKFTYVDWACRAAAWDGVYGVRASAVCDLSHGVNLSLTPGYRWDGSTGQSGHHVRPGSRQSLMVAFVCRMAPGLNSADGAIACEYTEWDGSGRQIATAGYNVDTTIPNDGTWQLVWRTVTTNDSAASATIGMAPDVTGVYDVDAVSVRDAAAFPATLAALAAITGGTGTMAEALAAYRTEYIRGERMERYVTAEEVCDAGSAAALSVNTYGRRESVIDNPDILTWNADAKSYVKAQFERLAVPLRRDRVELTHEHIQTPSPGEGSQVRISGLASGDLTDWAARVQYTWNRGALAVSMELSNERPTLAKLLKARTASSSGGGSGVSGSTSAGSGGTVTPAATPVASAATSGTVKITAAHADPVVYEKTEIDALFSALPSPSKQRWSVSFFEAGAAASAPDKSRIWIAPSGPGNTAITWIPKLGKMYCATPAATATTVDIVLGAAGNAAFGAGTTLLAAPMSLTGTTNYEHVDVTVFASGQAIVSGDRLAAIWSAIGGSNAVAQIEFEEQ